MIKNGDSGFYWVKLGSWSIAQWLPPHWYFIHEKPKKCKDFDDNDFTDIGPRLRHPNE